MNEIKPYSVNAAPAVVQTGDRSVFVENRDGSSVNFNFNIMVRSPSGRVVQEIHPLNMSRYHLIVTNADIFDAKCIDMDTNRSLVKGTVSNDAFEKYASLSPAAVEDLLAFPAIICQENTGYFGDTDSEQVAIYGLLQKIVKDNKNIRLYFYPLNYIPQHLLCENAEKFGIDITCAISDLKRKAWTLKDVNLAEACRDIGIPILVQSM